MKEEKFISAGVPVEGIKFVFKDMPSSKEFLPMQILGPSTTNIFKINNDTTQP